MGNTQIHKCNAADKELKISSNNIFKRNERKIKRRFKMQIRLINLKSKRKKKKMFDVRKMVAYVNWPFLYLRSTVYERTMAKK